MNSFRLYIYNSRRPSLQNQGEEKGDNALNSVSRLNIKSWVLCLFRVKERYEMIGWFVEMSKTRVSSLKDRNEF